MKSGVVTNNDLKKLARWAAAGRLGTPAIWKAAEERWLQRGIIDDDFHAMTDDHWPFDEQIAERGFPFVAPIYLPREEDFQTRIMQFLNQFHQIPQSHIKSWLASTILYSLSSPIHHRRKLDFPSLTALQQLFRAVLVVGRQQFPLDWLHESIDTLAPLSPEWIDFLDWLGRARVGFYGGNLPWPHTEQLVHSFSAAPETRRGLLPLPVALAVSGNKCEVIRLWRSWGDHAKDDASLLRVARGDWTPEEATELVKSIVGSKSGSFTVWRAFRILTRSPMARGASFALAVLRQLSVSSQEENQIMNRTMSALTEYLTKRPSPLDDHDVWRRLNLPESV